MNNSQQVFGMSRHEVRSDTPCGIGYFGDKEREPIGTLISIYACSNPKNHEPLEGVYIAAQVAERNTSSGRYF